jgi:calcineurin-like phosphoesterase family protein
VKQRSPSFFFTADRHFGVAPINLGGLWGNECATAAERDELLVRGWNRVVNPGDTVWVLGDLFENDYGGALAILGRLNGRIHLIEGNHDDTAFRLRNYGLFDWHYSRAELLLPDNTTPGGKRRVILDHYPISPGQWPGADRGSWLLHGHAHGNSLVVPRRLDVGMFPLPVSWPEVRDLLSKMQRMTS